MNANSAFDVFSGVPREEQKKDKKSLPFDYVDSDASSDEEAPYGENLGKFNPCWHRLEDDLD